MPKKGDSFTVEIKKSHIRWGTERKTNTRKKIKDEGYIKIPSKEAKSLGIYNKNRNGFDQLGVNVFDCESEDGAFNGEIKATGGSKKGSIHAKQFSGNGNLKALGKWYKTCNAKVGDKVKVSWESDKKVVIKHIPQK